MSTTGPFAQLPNDILTQILSHLPNKNKLGIARTSRRWRFLTNALLNPIKAFVNEEYPFLVEGKVSDSKYFELFERQEKVYTNCLAGIMNCGGKQLSRADLSRKSLKENFNPLNPSDDLSLNAYQKRRLREFAVASGVIEPTQQESACFMIFSQIAGIGNLEKLKEWNEGPNGNHFKEHRESALQAAVRNGQLKCMKYLVQACGKATFAKGIERTLLWALVPGVVEEWRGVAYLMKQFKNDISTKSKEEAVLYAAQNGYLKCMQYLIKNCEDISAESKKMAVNAAIAHKRWKCVQSLIESGEDISKIQRDKAMEDLGARGELATLKYFIEIYEDIL